MALGFGRKKDASDAPDAQEIAPPVNAVTPASDDADEEDSAGQLDLDSFAAELQSGHGLTHEPGLDSALRTPAPSEDDDPFGFASGGESTVESLTEPEPLDLNKMFEVETREAVAAGKIPAPAPYVPASMANAPEPERPFYDPQIPIPPAKKKLPLIPILGVVAVLIVAGVGAKFFMGSSSSDDETSAPVLNSTHVPAANSASLGAPASKPAPVNPVAGSGVPAAGAASNAAISPAATPISAETPEIQAQLTALWKKGAAAKQAKDYAGARAAWEAALKLSPNHPGFADSIAKLPPK